MGGTVLAALNSYTQLVNYLSAGIKHNGAQKI